MWKSEKSGMPKMQSVAGSTVPSCVQGMTLVALGLPNDLAANR
jgi:hypothetical protein